MQRALRSGSFAMMLVAVYPISAPAQQWFNNPGLNAMNSSIQRDATMAQIRNQGASVSKQVSSSSGSQSNLGPEATRQLSYKPSLARRQENLANFIAQSRTNDPQGAAQMERIFASADIIQRMGKGMAAVGLRNDNIADAYAVYWSSLWHVSAGSSATPTRAQFAKIKNQVAAALVATPGIIGTADDKKQAFAEALLVQVALIDASIEQAKGNPAQLKAIADAVRQGAKASGLDLEAMRLTDEGFRSVQ